MYLSSLTHVLHCKGSLVSDEQFDISYASCLLPICNSMHWALRVAPIIKASLLAGQMPGRWINGALHACMHQVAS
jgi:hypothetical protein